MYCRSSSYDLPSPYKAAGKTSRVAQVVDLVFESSSRRRREYSQQNHGVAVVALVDRALPGDHELQPLFQHIESDSEVSASDDESNSSKRRRGRG